MTTEEKIDRLTAIVDTLASSVVAHDNQIDALIKIATRHEEAIAALNRQVEQTSREFQAYLKRLPPQ